MCIRDSDTYYIANSTFEWFPGVRLHESKDLVHWNLRKIQCCTLVYVLQVEIFILYTCLLYTSGLGNTLIPLASGIAEFVMRVSVALLLPKLIEMCIRDR